jgi:cytochrome c biogenesis protein CcmG/thiol:disulfide interchange protein DsbE
MNRWAAFAPLLVLALIIIAGAILLVRPGERPTFSTGLIGQPAPAYALPRLDEGPVVSAADHPPGAYVINLFASWCVPCRAEHEQLLALQAAGVHVVGVAYKDAPEDATRFLQELGDPYVAVGLDREGRFGLDMGATGVPETYVIGADGRIRAVHRGPLTEDILNREILPALNAR